MKSGVLSPSLPIKMNPSPPWEIDLDNGERKDQVCSGLPTFLMIHHQACVMSSGDRDEKQGSITVMQECREE